MRISVFNFVSVSKSQTFGIKTGDWQDSESKAQRPPSEHTSTDAIHETADIRQETPTLFPILGVPHRATAASPGDQYLCPQH